MIAIKKNYNLSRQIINIVLNKIYMVKISGVNDILNVLDAKTHTNIQRITLNKVGQTTSKEIKREITSVYAIMQKDLDIQTKNATQGHMVYEISAPARQRNIAAFRVKQDKRRGGGLYATIKRGKEEFIRGAFLVTINNHKLAMKRKGKERLPIQSLYRLSIGHLLKSQWIQSVIERVFITTYDKYLSQSIEYLTQRISAAGGAK